MVSKQKILIVDDDNNIAELISLYLTKECYDTQIVNDGEEALRAFETFRPNLILLDLMLPGMDGITLLKKARKSGCSVPVLILTAKSEIDDRVLGLESGADYYLTKPFDMQELLAVMKTILRRRGEVIPECLSLGNILLNQADYTLNGPEKSIRLGKKEYDLLRILFVNRDMVVSKETLLSKIWGSDGEAVDNNVEIYISFLRKKLEFLNADVVIVTIRRLGYRIMEKNGGGGRE